MKRCCTFAVVGILCFMLAACQPGAAGLSDQDDAAIRKHDADWTRMVSVDKPDWDAAVNSYYAEDAKVLVPGAPPVEGRQAIKAMFSSPPRNRLFSPEAHTHGLPTTGRRRASPVRLRTLVSRRPHVPPPRPIAGIRIAGDEGFGLPQRFI